MSTSTANSSASSSDLIPIKARCHCGALTASSTFPRSSLPIPLHLCSCTNCRYASGLLAITSLSFKRPITLSGPYTRYDPLADPSSGYAWCFCPTCGTPIREETKDPNTHSLTGGTLDPKDLPEDAIDFRGCVLTVTAADGGMAVWFDESVAKWELNEEGGKKGGDWKPNPKRKEPKQPKREDRDRLRCECHCGGVRFEITRPGAAEETLKVAEKSTQPGREGQEVSKEKWWVRSDGTKYAACLCTCNSCRLTAGFDVQSWAFVPRANIVYEGTDRALPFPLKDGDLGSLKRYESSKGISRFFCGKCGAKVLFQEDQNPGLVDVSVGLMRADSGARAEEWLEWRWGRVSSAADALNKPLVRKLEKGLREWGEKTGKGYEGLEWEEKPFLIE